MHFCFSIPSRSIAVAGSNGCWDRCKASPLVAALMHLLSTFIATLSGSVHQRWSRTPCFSLCLVSLVNSPGVITAKIRLSIKRGLWAYSWFTLPHTCSALPRSPRGRASTEGQSGIYGSSYSLLGSFTWPLLQSYPVCGIFPYEVDKKAKILQCCHKYSENWFAIC